MTETVQRENVATPLSGDLIDILRGQLQGGQMGLGLGPLQQEAGTAARQFVNSGGGAANRAVSDLMDVQRLQRQQGLRDLGEQFGIAGSSLGTPQSVGQARFLSEAIPREQSMLSQLFLQGQQNQLSGIDILNQIAQSNLAPFLSLAGRGIIDPDVVATESPFTQVSSALGGAAQGAGKLIPVL